MKKINFIFLLMVLISTSNFAQPSEYWQTGYTTVGAGNRTNATLFEKDQTFISVGGRVLYEDTYYLEIRDLLQLPLVGSAFLSNYFYATEVENNGMPFFFAAERTGASESKMYLNTFTKLELLETEFEIPDLFEEEQSKGPAAVQINDGEIRIFGNQAFHKVLLSSDGSISLEWSKPASYGLIADAKVYNGGYILCNEDGKLVYVDAESETIWVKDIDAVMEAILVLDDGFMIAGEIDQESALIKTDFDGNILWEKKYGAGIAMDLNHSNEGGIVFTGRSTGEGAYVSKTDIDGILIWTEYYDAINTGVKVISSQYGGYLAQNRGNISTNVIRIAEDGSTGERITNILPKKIEANNVSTTVGARGYLFWNGGFTNTASTTFPKDSLTTTLFAGGLWISALDQDGFLHSAFTDYSLTDFTPGPFSANVQDGERWDNVWRITRKQIDQFQEDIADGSLDRAITLDLWTYPGSGNPNFNLLTDGQIIVPDNTAPFVDVNNDGIYNVLDGDYPEMKGDDMIWWAMSNKMNGTNLSGVPMDIEVKGTIYAHSADPNQLLYNTALLDLEITNYSSNEYSDMHIGTFIDFDIGCYLDDNIGTLATTNSIYGYNSSATDGAGGCNGYPSFEPDAIPLQSVTYLNKDMNYSMYSSNNSLGEFETYPPSNPAELHSFLQANWIDGAPLTEGGNGYGGTVETDYVFPGNPSDQNEWTMCSENLPENDRRMLMVTGPQSLALGQITRLDLGILTHENIDYACPDLSQAEEEITGLQDLYDTGCLGYNLYLGPDQDLEMGEVLTLDAGSEAISYFWSTGATSQTIEVDTAGIYAVTITTDSGCEYTDEISIGDIIISVNEFNIDAPKIYPNPASDQLFIEFTEELPKHITLENTLGQRLKTYTVDSGAAYSTMELKVSNLSQGMYILRFHYEEQNKTLLQKLIITK